MSTDTIEKLSSGKDIDWTTVDDPETQIDWDNIDFLTHESRDGCLVIKRYESIPQFGGLTPILAYRRNFLRYLKNFPGGEEMAVSFISDEGLLWDMSMTLARGGEIPFGTSGGKHGE